MPDLSTVAMERCLSWYETEDVDGSSEDREYLVSVDNCTCKGFIFNKTCKHVKAFRANHCLWDEQIDGGKEQSGLCPQCGGPTDTYMAAV